MPNIKEIELRTTFPDGQECVNRTPPKIIGKRHDVDVVRITNRNPPGTGSSITLRLDPQTRGNVFQSPPAGPQNLAPGESVDLVVKPVITTPQSEGFTTEPQSCHSHDAGDIVIQP